MKRRVRISCISFALLLHPHHEFLELPESQYKVTKPFFYGATLRDYVCLTSMGKHTVATFCPNATVVDFDTDHWVQLAAPEKLNEEIFKFVEGVRQK